MNFFPNFRECSMCKELTDESKMSINPFERNEHILVCKDCREWCVKNVEEKKTRKPKRSFITESPLEDFWDTEYKALQRSHF